MLDNVANDLTFIKRIVTGDETQIFHYDVEYPTNGAPKMNQNQNSLKAQKAIPAEAFNLCIDKWIKRWIAFIGSGAYFVGDNKVVYKNT